MKIVPVCCLVLLIFAACRMPKDYLHSEFAPKFGDVVDESQINKFLDSLDIPAHLRFFPILDSLPNRTYYWPTSLLFKGQDTFINTTLCNAHYKNINKTIDRYDAPNLFYPDYSLADELKSLDGVTLSQLPQTDYYLVFYWSLTRDNINFRHFTNMRKALENNDLSLTILYVNIDNRKDFNLSPEGYKQFLLENRRKVHSKDRRWIKD